MVFTTVHADTAISTGQKSCHSHTGGGGSCGTCGAAFDISGRTDSHKAKKNNETKNETQANVEPAYLQPQISQNRSLACSSRQQKILSATSLYVDFLFAVPTGKIFPKYDINSAITIVTTASTGKSKKQLSSAAVLGARTRRRLERPPGPCCEASTYIYRASQHLGVNSGYEGLKLAFIYWPSSFLCWTL